MLSRRRCVNTVVIAIVSTEQRRRDVHAELHNLIAAPICRTISPIVRNIARLKMSFVANHWVYSLSWSDVPPV